MPTRLPFSVRRTKDLPIPDKRRSARLPCAISAFLFDQDGLASSATILDRSEAGVRVICDEAGFHQKARFILRLDTGAAYAVRRVWYVGEVGGYEFTRRVDGTRLAGDRALPAAWQEHQAAREKA